MRIDDVALATDFVSANRASNSLIYKPHRTIFSVSLFFLIRRPFYVINANEFSIFISTQIQWALKAKKNRNINLVIIQ